MAYDQDTPLVVESGTEFNSGSNSYTIERFREVDGQVWCELRDRYNSWDYSSDAPRMQLMLLDDVLRCVLQTQEQTRRERYIDRETERRGIHYGFGGGNLPDDFWDNYQPLSQTRTFTVTVEAS